MTAFAGQNIQGAQHLPPFLDNGDRCAVRGDLTAALRGTEAGRRLERVEWGLRFRATTFLHRKGTVEPRPSEQNARQLAGRAEYGWRDTEVVSRTVVTYTTRWEPADG